MLLIFIFYLCCLAKCVWQNMNWEHREGINPTLGESTFLITNSFSVSGLLFILRRPSRQHLSWGTCPTPAEVMLPSWPRRLRSPFKDSPGLSEPVQWLRDFVPARRCSARSVLKMRFEQLPCHCPWAETRFRLSSAEGIPRGPALSDRLRP